MAKPANRTGSGKFVKGQSGNPTGRPKIVGEIKELARQHTADAMKTLVDVMKDKKAPHAARVTAANTLIDRGYGKATTHIEANINLLERLSETERSALEAALELVARDKGEDAEGVARTTH